jgi:uncharacterized protein YbjT (DUF2867 family)
MTPPIVLVAGGSGDMGARIVRELTKLGAEVRLLTRPGSTNSANNHPTSGVARVEADYNDAAALQRAVSGADVVVSSVSGGRSVIVDAQRQLLDAAVRAGVPRFIPSDYAADYRRIPPRTNRNFELRREFAAHLDSAHIRATSILNGAFTDMLTGQAPIIAPRLRRVFYWSHSNQVLDFTSKDDTALFVAQVALDNDAPRFLEIAGDRVTARSLAKTMSAVTGRTFRPQWAGTISGLSVMARAIRGVSRDEEAAFPAWQGMQYLVSMFSGDAKLRHVDNDRYGKRSWTTAADVLRDHHQR